MTTDEPQLTKNSMYVVYQYRRINDGNLAFVSPTKIRAFVMSYMEWKVFSLGSKPASHWHSYKNKTRKPILTLKLSLLHYFVFNKFIYYSLAFNVTFKNMSCIYIGKGLMSKSVGTKLGQSTQWHERRRGSAKRSPKGPWCGVQMGNRRKPSEALKAY